MGYVISTYTDQDDIFAEVKTVVAASAAQGGAIAEIAGKELVPTHVAIVELDAELLAARAVAEPLKATLEVARARANEVIHLAYDTTWNHVGRPAHDARLSLLFPGGASHYIEGEAGKLPGRMELLARLYDKGVHPKLSKAQNKELAGSIRAAAKVHSDALEAAWMPEIEVTLLERTRTIMARTAQATLVNFKRHLKMAGYTEAQVHTIIPDRKPVKKGAAKKADAKRSAASAPAASAPAAPAPAAPAPAAPAPDQHP